MIRYISVIFKVGVSQKEAEEKLRTHGLSIDWVFEDGWSDDEEGIGVITINSDQRFNEIIQALNKERIVRLAHEPPERKPIL